MTRIGERYRKREDPGNEVAVDSVCIYGRLPGNLGELAQMQ